MRDRLVGFAAGAFDLTAQGGDPQYVALWPTSRVSLRSSMRAPKYIADFAFPQIGISGGSQDAYPQERSGFPRT
jgi:hypothetical protein